MPLRYFLFDIDGTLVNCGGAGGGSLLLALSEVFGVRDPSPLKTYSGRTDRAILAELLELHGVENTMENRHRLVAAYLEILPGQLAKRRGRVLPGVNELLDQLSGEIGLGLGLLTGNLHRGAELKLGHFGLASYFRVGAFGDEHESRDELVHEALSQIRRELQSDVAGEEVCIIGDTPLDIACARVIGAVAIAVATGIHSAEDLAAAGPDVLLEDLSATGNVLATLLRTPARSSDIAL